MTHLKFLSRRYQLHFHDVGHVWNHPESILTYRDLLADILQYFSRFWMSQPFKQWPVSWIKDDLLLGDFLYQEGQKYSQSIQYHETLQGFSNTSISHVPTLTQFQSFIPEAKILSQLPQLLNSTHDSCHFFTNPHLKQEELLRIQHAVKSHKIKQIESFIQHIPSLKGNVLDWCGGKGHLARHVSAVHQLPTACLEWDSTLIQSAQVHPAYQQSSIDFHLMDALSEEAKHLIHSYQNIISLHACGPLHRRLLEVAYQHPFKTLHIAPCCYSLDRCEHTYCHIEHPFSRQFTGELLSLATQQKVHVSTRRNQARIRGLAMRLGFSVLIHRSINQSSHDSRYPNLYPLIRVRSTPRKVNQFPFLDACKMYWKYSDLHTQMREPNWHQYSTQELAAYEYQGWHNLAIQTPFEHVRQIFRPILEQFLVLDRACYLLQSPCSYQVDIKRFCKEELTPRNYLIQAYHTV